MQRTFRIKTNTPQRYAFVHNSVPASEFGAFLGEALARVWQYLGQRESVTVGPAIARYHGRHETTLEVDAGFPIADELTSTEHYQVEELPGGRVATVLHWGPYDNIAESWAALETWMRQKGITGTAQRWEIYWVDATQTDDPAELRAELVWPIVDQATPPAPTDDQ